MSVFFNTFVSYEHLKLHKSERTQQTLNFPNNINTIFPNLYKRFTGNK